MCHHSYELLPSHSTARSGAVRITSSSHPLKKTPMKKIDQLWRWGAGWGGVTAESTKHLDAFGCIGAIQTCLYRGHIVSCHVWCFSMGNIGDRISNTKRYETPYDAILNAGGASVFYVQGHSEADAGSEGVETLFKLVPKCPCLSCVYGPWLSSSNKRLWENWENKQRYGAKWGVPIIQNCTPSV